MFRFLNALALRLLYMTMFATAGGLFVWMMFAVPAVGILFMGGLLWRRYHAPPSLSAAHGTARWAGFVDLFRAGMLGRQGLILGQVTAAGRPSAMETIQALFLWRLRNSQAAVEVVRRRLGFAAEAVVRLPDHGSPHIAAFGSSGCGKSTSYVIPNLQNDCSAAVVLDPKGEIFQATAPLRARQFGHEIVRIDPYDIAPSSEFPAQGFNPLSLTDPGSPLAVDDARRLANAIVVRNPETHEPFWDNSALIFIQAIIIFLLAKLTPKYATLNTLRDILCSPQALDQTIAAMENATEYQGILSRMAGQLATYQEKTRASTLSVVGTHLDFLDSLPVAGTIAETTFDPRQLLQGNMTIYLCLPVDRISELTGLQRIIVSSLINMIFQAGESRQRRVRFYLDEASTLREIEPLYSALVFGRSFGIRLFLLFQSISQVELCFPKTKANDFKATVASLFAGTNDFATAQEVSQWIGQSAAHSVSTQNSRNWGTSTNGGQSPSDGTSQGYSTSATINEVARSVIRPEEVLQLTKEEAIVLLPHQRPFIVQKMPYYAAQRKLRPLLNRIGEAALLGTACLAGLLALCAFGTRTTTRTSTGTPTAFHQRPSDARQRSDSWEPPTFQPSMFKNTTSSD